MNFSDEPKPANPQRAEMDAWHAKLKKLADESKGEVNADSSRKIKSQISITSDSRILEITCGNVYVRIVAGEARNRQRPFHFYRYVSVNTPESPKTDFYRRQKQPFTPMDASNIEKEIDKEVARIKAAK